MVRILTFFSLLITFISGCEQTGRLIINLQRPQDKTLDPLIDLRLSKFSLRIIEKENIIDHETFRADDNLVPVGTVPVGVPFDLRLSGKSTTGQMLGLGLIYNVQVAGDSETTVTIKFRKPIGYVAGEPGLEILDATASTSEKVPMTPNTSVSNVVDVVATPDSSWLALLTNQTLVFFRTADQKKWAEVKLDQGSRRVWISLDKRYAIVSHGSQNLLSVIDLANLDEKSLEVRTIQMSGNASKVVFEADRKQIKILIDGETAGGTCKAQSKLATVDLESTKILEEINLQKPVADIAISPTDNNLILALPCENALGRIEGRKAKVLSPQLPTPYDLMLTDKDLVVLGSALDSTNSIKGQAVLFNLARNDLSQKQTKTFPLPSLRLWFKNPGADGELVWQLKLKSFMIQDSVISPDGQRAVGLFSATYSSNLDFYGCPYLLDMKATGYLLVDLDVDMVLYWRLTQLQFTQCQTCKYPSQGQCESWVRSALISNQGLSQPEYVPQGATLLFGGT